MNERSTALASQTDPRSLDYRVSCMRDLFKYGAAVVPNPSDAAAAVQAVTVLREWVETGGTEDDIAVRMSALNLQYVNWPATARGRQGRTVEQFIEQAEVYYAYLKDGNRLHAPVTGAATSLTPAEDVVVETIRRAGRPLTPAEIWDQSIWAAGERGWDRRYSSLAILNALTDLRAAGRVCQDGERAPYYLPQPEPTASPSVP